jgi:rfaE bifunctional protein kinase chain/domain
MKEAEFQRTIKAFEGKTVLIAGDVMVDTYLWGEAERISPEAPVPVVRAKDKEHRLGGAANVALNIKALGGTPLLCSVIGQDDTGDSFKQLLQEYQLSEKGLIETDQRPTTQKSRIFSKNQQMLRLDKETTKPLSESLINKLSKRIVQLLSEVDVLIFQDYDKGTLTPPLIKKVIKASKEEGVPTTADPKQRHFFEFNHVTLFKPNLHELKTALNSNIPKVTQNVLEQAGKQLLEQLPHNITFVTLADKGIWARYDGQSKIIPAHARNVSDVSGAGDTVISIASLGLTTELPIFKIAELANIGAGVVCKEVGVVPITKEKLLKEVSTLLS